MGTIALDGARPQQSGSSTAVGGILVLRLIPAARSPARSRARAASTLGPAAHDAHHGPRARRHRRGGAAGERALVGLPVGVHARAREPPFLLRRDASIPDLGRRRPADRERARARLVVRHHPAGRGAFALAAVLTHVHIGMPGSRSANFALAFWIDAATFLVSFAIVRGIADLRRRSARGRRMWRSRAGPARRTFTEALRIPLIRAVIPATTDRGPRRGALFSLGIVFVRDLLGATNAEFGAMIALFGVGAAGGLGLRSARRDADLARNRAHRRCRARHRHRDHSAWRRRSRAPSSVPSGSAGPPRSPWPSGMSALQARLEDEERVLAFTVFHVVDPRRAQRRRARGRHRGRPRRRGDLAARRHLEPERARAVLRRCFVFASSARVRWGDRSSKEACVSVAIVTDSAASLPADLVDAARHVAVVPMWLTLDGESASTRAT